MGSSYLVSGVDTYFYRVKRSAEMSWGPWVELADENAQGFINNSSGIDESWDVESKHVFTPNNPLYAPAEFTKVTTLTVQPTTQITFSTHVSNPDPFASGNVRIRANYSESPAYGGAGTRVFQFEYQLCDFSGYPVLEGIVNASDIGGGIIESDIITVPVLYDASFGAAGYFLVIATGTVTGTPIENSDGAQQTVGTWQANPTVPIFSLSGFASSYNGMGFPDGYDFEIAVSDTTAQLTIPDDVTVTATITFYVPMGGPLGTFDLEMTYDSGAGVFRGFTGNGMDLFAYSGLIDVYVEINVTSNPFQSGITPGNYPSTNIGSLTRIA